MCSGFDSGAEFSDEAFRASCGSLSLNEWTIDCNDVNRRRLTKVVNGTLVHSDAVTAHVAVCPEARASSCSNCQGGFHPSFRVRVKENRELDAMSRFGLLYSPNFCLVFWHNVTLYIQQ